MKIMLSAGEVSGDLHGERLAHAIHEKEPRVELIGFGGARMERAGVRLFRNFADYNVMGVLEVIQNFCRIMKLLDALTAFMKRERPDLLVIIDYPDFNWRLARRAKALGIPVFSYIPPSAWAWRKGRAKDCAKIADEFVAIFPHELPPYEAAGAKIAFVGNPLVDTVRAEIPPEAARAFFGAPEGEHIVLLMPGSRRQEITMLLGPMLGAAKILLARRADTRFFLPVADASYENVIQAKIEAAGVPVTLVRENRYALMAIADAAVAASGTVVMEAALMGMPCVTVYRLSWLNYWIGRALVHIDHFTLPNILMGERIQPELLQDEVEPKRIADELERLYRGNPNRAAVTAKLRKAAARLGAPGAAGRIAERILAAARHSKTGTKD
ncbi:MAG: lipid-A-disaccharide synthase [Mitsuokella sp.]|mgnify:CR=1 FL=1